MSAATARACYRVPADMRDTRAGRIAALIAAAASILVGATAPVASEATTSPLSTHRAIGMFSVESAAGGAVWTFRDDGMVRLIGPGEAFAMGSWSAGDGDDRRLQGSIDVRTSAQTLTFDGQVSADGSAIALLVRATEPLDPAGIFDWPPESRLVGRRVGFRPVEPDPSASRAPSPSPASNPAATASPSMTAEAPRPSPVATEPSPAAEPSQAAAASPGPVPVPSVAGPELAVAGECVVWGEPDGVAWEPCPDASTG